VSNPVAPTGTAAQTFCAINNPTVANLAATGTAIKWYTVSSGGVALATTTALVDGTHYYASQTISGCESINRLDVTATVDNPAAPTGTALQSFCAINGPTVADLSATGIAIKWYAASSGGTALATTTALVNGTHYYASQTVLGCEGTARFDVTVTVGNPAAPTGSASQSFCTIDNATVADLAATGTGIQWYTASSGGTALATTTALVSGTHYYASQTIFGCEGIARLDVTATIYDPPVITTEPDAIKIVCNTFPVTFTVAATGDGLTYQWYKGAAALTDNASVTGSNTNQLTIDPTAASDDGTYHVVVSGTSPCTAVTSADAVLEIHQLINITSQPTTSQTLCEGSTFTLTVAATGSSLSYQWRKNTTNLVDGGNISGANTATLTLSNITPADASSQYNVVIIDADVDPGDCNTAFSNKATLIVNPTTVGGAVASAQTICSGAQPSSLTLSGNTGSVVKWQSSADAAFTSPIDIAVTSTTLTGAQAGTLTSNTYFRAVVQSGVCASANSSAVLITIDPVSVGGTVSADQTICSGTTPTSDLTLSGNTGNVVRWEKSTSSTFASGVTPIANTSTTLTAASIGSLATSTYFRAVVQSGVCLPANSASATITVTPTTTVANAGADKTVNCALSTNLAGNTPTNGTGSWSIIGGAGGTIANPSSPTSAFSTTVTSTTTYVLRWTISNPPCASTTDDVSITFIPPISNDSIFIASLCRDPATGQVQLILGQHGGPIAGGSGTYTYSWEQSCNGSSSFVTLPGQTGPSLVLTQVCNNAFYKRHVTSSPCATTTSGAVNGNGDKLHINVNNNLSLVPYSITPSPTASYCNGGSGVEVKTTGSLQAQVSDPFTPFDVQYKLYRDGVLISTLSGTGSALNFGFQKIAGTYTVTETITLLTPGGSSCGATNLTGSLVISIDQPVTTSVAGPNQTVCGSTTATLAGNSSAAPNGTGVWTLVSGAGTITTPTSPTSTVTGLGSGANVFRWTISNTCGTSFSDVTIAGSYIWSGANNTTDWFTASNWLGGVVPAAGSCNVTIPVVAINKYPVITSGTAIANSITINSGASVIVNGTGLLQIGGTITNNGTLNVINGAVEFNGTSGAQTIAANVFSTNTIKDLIISNNVTLGGTLNLTDSLSFGSSSKIFTTGGNLTLKSSATNTATVCPIINSNSISGAVTVERYFPARRAWRFLAVPTNTSQSVKQAWQEGATSLGDNPVPGYGTQVTDSILDAATLLAKGFDYYSNLGPSVKWYNPATNTYPGITGTSVGIKTNQGWMTFVRGDRTAIGLYADPTPVILRTKGDLYTGPQSFSVGSNQFQGINNPYAAPLDMRNITVPAGINNTFYLWDPNLGGSSGLGAFVTFSYNGSSYDQAPAIYPAGYSYIQSGQAFFMYGGGGGGNLILTENSKASATAASSVLVFMPAYPVPESRLRINLHSHASDGSSYLVDGALEQFSDNYKNAVDKSDARKMLNLAENFAIKTDSQLLVIEKRHTIVDADTLQLNIQKMKVKSYKFEFVSQNFDPSMIAFLEDSYSHTKTPININGTTTYDFNVINEPASWNPARFRVVFKVAHGPLPAAFNSIKAYQLNNDISVDWVVNAEKNIAYYEVEKSADGQLFTLAATIDAKGNNSQNVDYRWLDSKPITGANYYRIKTVNKNGEITYSDMVKVIIGKGRSEIKVYPNPIVGGKINVHFINLSGGKYEVRIVNALGQVMLSRQVHHAETTNLEVIKLNKNVAKGTYRLEVTLPDKSKMVTNLFLQ
jgi:hypothetical protein